MSTLVALRHQTSYVYDRPVQLGPHLIRLRPTGHSRASIANYCLSVSPDPEVLHWQEDPCGNRVARCTFQAPLSKLIVAVALAADLPPANPFDFLLAPEAEELPVRYEDRLAEVLAPYRHLAPAGPNLTRLLESLDRSQNETVPFLVGLNQRVHEEIAYQQRTDPGVFDPEQTLEQGVGSCRDTAWLLAQTLRHVGLATRFVSGYLIQLDVESESTYAGGAQTEDQVALHAWAEVYLPGAGWVGFDPTSGLLTAEGHIPLAAAPEPTAAAPLSGSTGPSTARLEYDMSIERIGREQGALP